MTIRVVSLKNHRYGVKNVLPGEEYEMKGPSEFSLYKAMGWVKEAPEIADHAWETETDMATGRVIHRAPAKKAKKTAAKKGGKRQYKRRDMTAE